MAHRVGAIDIGTNTVLLLVAEGSPDAPRAILERATITRLGQGVDREAVAPVAPTTSTVIVQPPRRSVMAAKKKGP